MVVAGNDRILASHIDPTETRVNARRASNRNRHVVLALLTALGGVSTSDAEEQRARPPEFTDEDREPFFEDAFDSLVGQRPTATAASVAEADARPQVASEASVAWADLIAPDVLETEIKRQAGRLGKATRSATTYKAGGYRDGTDSLGVLATLFAVTAEHDGRPRWRDVAAGLRTLLAESYEAADAGTAEAHQIAAARAADLSDLIRGGRPDVPPPAEASDWSEFASRSNVMRRMEAAEKERLGQWVTSERAMRRNAEDARHEAQVLAALAEAILRPAADDFDDADYQAFARQLRDASVDLAAAAEAEDQAAAAKAMTAVSRSCVDCHAGYRG